MARSTITVQTLAAYGASILDHTTNRDAADATNDHQFTHPGGDVLLIVENGSGSTMAVEIKAVSGPGTFGMAEDGGGSVATGKTAYFSIPDYGFNQGSNVVHIDIDQDTSSYLSIVKITPSPR